MSLDFSMLSLWFLMEEIRVGLLSRCVVSVPEGERLSWDSGVLGGNWEPAVRQRHYQTLDYISLQLNRF